MNHRSHCFECQGDASRRFSRSTEEVNECKVLTLTVSQSRNVRKLSPAQILEAAMIEVMTPETRVNCREATLQIYGELTPSSEADLEGDKLEIVILKADGIKTELMDLRKSSFRALISQPCPSAIIFVDSLSQFPHPCGLHNPFKSP